MLLLFIIIINYFYYYQLYKYNLKHHLYLYIIIISQLLSMKSKDIQCSKCYESGERILAVECGHHLCLSCANKVLLKLQKNKPKVTHIQCQICNVISYLHPESYQELINTQLLKKSKTESFSNRFSEPLKLGLSNNHIETVLQRQIKQDQPNLYCFSCFENCFSVEKYLNGLHKNHNVKTINKSFKGLKILLEELNEKVKKKMETGLKESTKLTQKKRELIECLGGTKSALKIQFEKIREMLQKKENEMLSRFEDLMSSRFNILDKHIHKIRLFIERCEQYEEKIRYYEEMNEGSPFSDLVQAFNFYTEKREDILQLSKENLLPSSGTQLNFEDFSEILQQSIQKLTLNYEPLHSVIQSIKKLELNLNDTSCTERNYFQMKKNQIFNKRQEVTHDYKNFATIKKVKSFEQLKLQKKAGEGEERTSPSRRRQTRLRERMRDLESLMSNRKTVQGGGISSNFSRKLRH